MGSCQKEWLEVYNVLAESSGGTPAAVLALFWPRGCRSGPVLTLFWPRSGHGGDFLYYGGDFLYYGQLGQFAHAGWHMEHVSCGLPQKVPGMPTSGGLQPYLARTYWSAASVNCDQRSGLTVHA